MIQFVFTLDYEISGNGQGGLRQYVLEPAAKLKAIFDRHRLKFVAFVEVIELQQMEQQVADEAIMEVKDQVRALYRENYEIALHLHPQWCNARMDKGTWILDYAEYNLCLLPRERIAQVVDGAIGYLRQVIGEPEYMPLSFRAGNWLFQPSREVSRVLADCGICVDSSVFKGGRQGKLGLDYRRALHNGWCWKFLDDVVVPHSDGPMLEIPIYSKMVPFWKLLTSKRLGLKYQGAAVAHTMASRLGRLRDFIRLKQPLKLDFCNMTFDELTGMVEEVIREDQSDPGTFRPLVAIGHTKDLSDYETIEAFLEYLEARGIAVTTLSQIYRSHRWAQTV